VLAGGGLNRHTGPLLLAVGKGILKTPGAVIEKSRKHIAVEQGAKLWELRAKPRASPGSGRRAGAAAQKPATILTSGLL